MFCFDGRTYEYFDHPHNTTRLNERAVEIPIARQWIADHGMDLEVGNVLGHYGHAGHWVIDRYEPGRHVENMDVFDLASPVTSVVSISTLEHVRWDEPQRDPDGAIRALEHLRCISERLFLTVGMGYHPALDRYLLYGPHKATRAATLLRNGDGWVETDRPVWRRYGVSQSWAEAVWIGWWL